MRALFFGILYLNTFICFAQNESDSLRALIRDTQVDSTRLKLLLDLAYFYEVENRDSAIAIYDRSFALAEQSGNDLYCGKSLQYKSIVYHEMGKYAIAIVGYHKALNFFEKINYQKGIASTQNNIGNSYLYLADYQNALKHYMLANPFYSLQKDWLSLVTILGNMGECYRQLGDRVNMMKVARESHQYAVLTGDSIEIANAGISIGSAYNLNGMSDSSLFFLEQSLHIAESLKNESVMYFALHDLSDAKLKSGSFDEALRLATRSLEVAKDIDIDYFICGALLLQGRILSQSNAQTTVAEERLKSALDIATKIDASDHRLNIISALADLYESTGDAVRALSFRKAWIALNDTIFTDTKSRQINELNTLYELEEKEQSIELEKTRSAEKDKKLSERNSQITIALTLFILTILLAWMILKVQRNKRRLAEQEAIILHQKNETLVREHAEAQLKSIIDGQEIERKRIARELHDGLGGYLTSVHMKAQQLQKTPQDSQLLAEVSDMISTAGKEMRKISHDMAPEGLMRLGLVPTLEHYVQKMSTPSLEISFEWHGTSWPSHEYSEITIYRIAQELINNMLKHSKASTGFISLSYLPHEIHLVVEDNGIGIQQNLSHTEGQGIKNLRARITYLNAVLDIVSNPQNGSSFNIIIPKKHV